LASAADTESEGIPRDPWAPPPEKRERRIIGTAIPVTDRKRDPAFKPVASVQPAELKKNPHKHVPHHVRHPPPLWHWASLTRPPVKPKMIRGRERDIVRANVVHHEIEKPEHWKQPPLFAAHDVTRYDHSTPAELVRADDRVIANAHIDWHDVHIARRRAAARQPLVTANAHITRAEDPHRKHHRRHHKRHIVSAVGHITRDDDGHAEHVRRRHREDRREERHETVSADAHITADAPHRRKHHHRHHRVREPELVSAEVFRSRDELSAPDVRRHHRHHHRRPEPELVSAHVVRDSADLSIPQRPAPPHKHKPKEQPVSADIYFPRL